MVKKILFILLVLAIIIIAGAITFKIVTDISNDSALSDAREECSNEINPRASGDLVYSEYNKCMASKGFDEFK